MSAKIEPTGFDWYGADIASTPEITVLTEQDIGTGIQTFDVSPQNWTAVGFSNSCISIFDENAALMASFDLDITGVYYLTWEDDLLWVHSQRHKQSICISMDGEIISCSEIPDTENNASYWRILRSREEITMNDLIYQEIDGTITRTALDGTETIVVTTADEVKLTNQTFILLIGFMFLLVIITALLCIFERKGTEEEKEYPLTLRGFMRIRSDLWKDHIEHIKEHSHSTENCDES